MPIVALVVIVALIYAGLAFRWYVRSELAIGRLRALGVPSSPAELVGEEVAEDQNAAPIYAEVLQRVGDADWADGAVSLSASLPFAHRRQHPESWDEIRQIVHANTDLFPRIEQAIELPHYWVDVEPTCRGLGSRIGGMAKALRCVCQLLEARSMVRAADGDMDGAVADVPRMLRASLITSQQPCLLSFLVRVALLRAALHRMYDLLEQGAITEAQARLLYDELSTLDLAAEYTAAVRAESAFTCARDYSVPQKIRIATAFAATATNCELLRKLIEGAGLGYSEAESAQLVGPPGQLAPFRYWSTDVKLRRVNLARYMVISDIACCQAVLAVYAHRLEHEAWPSSLGDVKSSAGWDIPSDPFTGQDLIYELHPGGFRLRSAGREGIVASSVQAYRDESWADRFEAQLATGAAYQQPRSSLFGPFVPDA